MKTHVALFTFNRPRHARRVLEAIATYQPPVLYHIQDAPRPDHPTDTALCRECIELIGEVDWDCEVRRCYAEENLGCGRRIATGIDWVFTQTEEAILLEDDCLPDPSFFPYCQELLARYRDNPQVMHISGNNFQDGQTRTEYSYFFSAYAHSWGWATWRRAWDHFDIGMPDWPQARAAGWLRTIFPDPIEHDYWQAHFDRMHAGEYPSVWDYAWHYTCLRHGLCIYPEVNLVSNIGSGADASHTETAPHLHEPSQPIGPLRHPPRVSRHMEADRYTFDNHFRGRYRRPGWKRRLLQRVMSLFRR